MSLIYNGSSNTSTIGNLNINSTTSSISTTTGALVVSGGVGINGALNVSGISSFSAGIITGTIFSGVNTISTSQTYTPTLTNGIYILSYSYNNGVDGGVNWTGFLNYAGANYHVYPSTTTFPYLSITGGSSLIFGATGLSGTGFNAANYSCNYTLICPF